MKIGAFTTFLPEYSFADACRLLKAVGYDGVQPRIVAEARYDPTQPFNPWGNHRGSIGEADFFADPVGTLKPAADAGLAITSVASYANVSDLDRSVKMVKACAKAGVNLVRIGSLMPPKDEVYDWRALQERSKGLYRELVAEAKKVGVRPCLELHNGTAHPSPSGAVAFLSGFSPDEVGILYDPANMIMEGLESVTLSLNILGPYLAEVHVKNNRWVPDGEDARGVKKWKATASDLEDGCVNWAEVIDKLKAHGYSGWLIEEGFGVRRNTHERIKHAHDFLRKLLG